MPKTENITAAQYRERQALEKGLKSVKRRNKYGNKRIVVDGVSFHSIGESKRCTALKMLERAGEIKELRLQPRFPIFINDILVFTYVADFEYYENGGLVVEDFKSEITRKESTYIIKKKCFEAYYKMKLKETS